MSASNQKAHTFNRPTTQNGNFSLEDEDPKLILIVDDEPFVADLLRHWVESVWGYPVTVALTGEDAIVQMRERQPKLVLLDINLPDINGIDVLRAMKSGDEHLPVVMVSAQESVATAVEALRAGAYDYLTKPIDTQRLQVIIRNALKANSYYQELRKLRGVINDRYDFSSILSADPRMHDIFKLLRKAASSDITVCIQGESGTGKELVARALHANSARKEHNFEVVNCSATPHELLEAELFGLEVEGAKRSGKFELAHKGTLFLDEIAEVELPLQAKLLRAIQNKEFTRAGSSETVYCDVRIICATNEDLLHRIKERQFREDLYYRVSTFPIVLPPLRERKGDILLLADNFLNRKQTNGNSEVEIERPVRTVSAGAISAMMNYPWPGNIRELESTLERALLIADDAQIQLGDLSPAIRDCAVLEDTQSAKIHIKEFFDSDRNKSVFPLEDLKRFAINHALSVTGGNMAEAAARLEISRSTLYRLLETYKHEEEIKNNSGLQKIPVPS